MGVRAQAVIAQTSSRSPAEQALQLTYQLPYGALAIKDTMIVVTATRCLNHTSQHDLTTVIQLITYYAAFYKGHYGC